MTAADLKASILDRAVHGLLVPQDPNDEPAAKPSSIDNPPYELPRGWVWKYGKEIGTMERGAGIKRNETTAAGCPCLRYGEIYTSYTHYLDNAKSFIPSDLFNACKHIKKNDLVFTLTGENEVDIAKTLAYLGDDEIAAGGDLAIWSNHKCHAPYLAYMMAAPSIIKQKAQSATGNFIVHTSTKKIGEVMMPLPPLAEQKRIVAKIEELMPLVEEYGKAETELAALNDNFPTALRKSILQHAVEGRLTAAWRKANPRGETAAELLAKIAAEKKHLLASGKIKKQPALRSLGKGGKPLPPITDDEKPFPIPDGWEWVRFCSLVDEISTGPFGSMLHKKDYVPSGIPIVNPANIVNEAIVPSDKMMVSEETRDRLSSYRLEDGMIVMARRGEMGRCAMVSRKEDGWLCGTGSFFMRLLGEVDGHYLIKFFATPHAKKALGGESVGTTMSNLNHGILNSIPIPLPPLAEQKAIVERVEELLGLVEKMKE